MDEIIEKNNLRFVGRTKYICQAIGALGQHPEMKPDDLDARQWYKIVGCFETLQAKMSGTNSLYYKKYLIETEALSTFDGLLAALNIKFDSVSDEIGEDVRSDKDMLIPILNAALNLAKTEGFDLENGGKQKTGSEQKDNTERSEDDIFLISGKPARIYKAIIDGLFEAQKKTGVDIWTEYPNLVKPLEYHKTVRERFSSFDIEKGITIDLNMVKKDKDGLEKLMTRLGFPEGLSTIKRDSKQELSAGFNSLLYGETTQKPEENRKIGYDLIKDCVMESLGKEADLKPVQPKSFEKAKQAIEDGKCVDLKMVAGIGGAAGQAGTAYLINQELSKIEIANLDKKLDQLKETEGTIFRYSTQDYDNVRGALEHVIKLHKRLEKFLKADPKDQKKYKELAQKAPTAEELKSAYETLDNFAKTYLTGKEKRLTERLRRNDYDDRGTKRFNCITMLRRVTDPSARNALVQRMAELDKMVIKARGEMEPERKSVSSEKNVKAEVKGRGSLI